MIWCMQVKASAAGTAHAIIMWWHLNLDSSAQLTLDTAPCWVARSGSDPAGPSGPESQATALPGGASVAASSDAASSGLLPTIDGLPKVEGTNASCMRLEQKQQQQQRLRQQQQQQRPKQEWRDHWKQCWSAVHPNFSTGMLSVPPCYKCNALYMLTLMV